MKIQCERGVLLGALSTAARAVSSRSSVAALEGLLAGADDSLSFTGYNMETGITAIVTECEILEKGEVVIPARMLVDIVRKMPDDTVTLTSTDDLMVEITCGAARFRVMGIAAGQYPKLPEFDRETRLTLPQKLLKSMLNGVLYAASVSENKTVHSGALFDLKDGLLNIAALDGFRLALRGEKVESGVGVDEIKFVAPGQALREIEHILSDEGEVNIIIGGRHILFELDGVTVLSRLLDGEFLDYKKAVPDNQTVILTADARELLERAERVSLLVNEKVKNPVRLICGDGQITFAINTPLGSANDVCPCEGGVPAEDGGEMEIGFNHRYLIDAIKAALSLPDGGDNITLKLSTPLSPCVIEPEGGEGYKAMVLPVRLTVNN